MARLAGWTVRLALWAIAFGLPLFALDACKGWNAGDGRTRSCDPDWPWLYELSDGTNMFMMVSSFTVLLPLVFYILLMGLLVELAALFARRLVASGP